ncbi:MAG TPA: ABC transporter substrate-binding protein [Candidatus Avidehalobacter gallistercoris]|uniref:ABC transporter substrate-binding protein n=1 Tax=Candidatus Avidehalobacter gallistercoris TaxID=2840694 RepID=A0A9D1HMT3_9FIRM|nr:ABC transporter substrate-binding protein [Candidatus Avidehalobacter gallistercoris]
MLKRLCMLLVMVILLSMFTACAGGEQPFDLAERETDISPDLTFERSMPLDYATEFAVDYYDGGYALITVSTQDRYLVIPEGLSAPAGLPEDIVPLFQPLDNIYIAASAVMDMFVTIDALDSVRFSALQASSWYVQPAREAMEAGEILFAGKHSTPDYEQILTEGCGLAVENTMIYHNPEVKEQLEKFGIPVLIDYSSYEDNPLGRTEWVKLYGLLTGHEDEAEAAFAAEQAAFEAISKAEATGKTVAFFYINVNGEVNVRSTTDYIPKMIEMAGGKYIFEDLGAKDETASTITMQMEDFYAQAKDADYIIYNSTIDGELNDLAELNAKSPLLEKFRAVQQGNVFCTTKNLYQETMELGTFISDINRLLSGETDGMTYIYKLE